MRMSINARNGRTVAILGLAGLVLLGTGATVAAASRGQGWGSMMGGGRMMGGGPLAAGASGRGGSPGWSSGSGVCTSASAPTVRYIGFDGGGMMGGSMNRLMPRIARVTAGAVTIDLVNRGARPHELLVFPLAANESPGTRVVGANDRVGEKGVLGEVSPVCAQPSSVDGIVPGNVGRVTLDLRPGRYELVCNLPGHYRTGMWAVLDVAG